MNRPSSRTLSAARVGTRILARFALCLCLIPPATLPARAGDGPTDQGKPYNPVIAAASDEGEKAIQGFRVPEGLKVDLFAAEPLLANPVAFCFDEKGVAYVAETFRHSAGVTDTRGHMNWLDADLACRTVADRVAMFRKYLGKDFEGYKVEQERVRRVVDTNGDGKADAASVFADGFGDPAAGIGAGVLARGPDVWYTCIPWLWRLRDPGGTGKATERILLHEGYGVHVGFLGHDLHGLRLGPDGRLYFSIGDRGINVKTREGRDLVVLDTGSVLRCEPDGSHLEVFATGLRNPQELAFDEHGNLFTCDNNSDSGDRARWVHVVEGGDSGWRIGFQFMERGYSRGPWNEEKMWQPGPAAEIGYIVPPLLNISDGPSGLTYNPGVTALPDKYKGHFFLADFRGGAGESGIRSLALRPKGASFEVVDPGQFVWRSLTTDVDFGPDGGLYFSDWVEGWDKPNKGRIYRVVDPSRKASPAVTQVKGLLAAGMARRSVAYLVALLAHEDMRIRQEAQLELAARGERPALAAVARGKGGSTLARIHAAWGLGQIARRSPAGIREEIEPLLADSDAEVRAQAARVLGEVGDAAAGKALIPRLADESPRVRSFAAIAIGRLGTPGAGPALIEMLRENDDGDPYLRHAGVMGLAGLKDRSALDAARKDGSRAVRRAAVVAMRRHEDPAVADFLDDADPTIVLEAARAINDVPIGPAMPRLATLPVTSQSPLPLLRRVANAAFRLGGPERARLLAAMAGRADLPEKIRLEALAMLGQWAKPSGRDRVVGLWRPIPERPASEASDALLTGLAPLLSGGSGHVRAQAMRAVADLGIKDAAPRLVSLARDAKAADETRAEAMKALESLDAPGQAEIARGLVTAGGPRARVEAVRILSRADPAAAKTAAGAILADGSTLERQGVLAILGEGHDPAGEEILLAWLDRLDAGKVPAELQLDVLEAAGKRKTPKLAEKLKAYEAKKPKEDPLSPYREALVGGDASRGREIFLSKAETTCLRCHKVALEGGHPFGGEVGPDLSNVGGRQPRDYILESIVVPDRKIAEGFESVVLALSDGKIVTGVLRGEDAKSIRVITAEGQAVIVAKDDVEDRKRGPSPMPADVVTKLTKQELRDLVEFLSGLKAK
ncbi:HEAT repeat protein [Aquisphaera giovannonii]|uniref:HEAT repeat protein n=1 Tax=Aquisphaera giovannonii TaxID=406548 RepID=A0A5B9WE20_9BACT|nr:HEAT repeat domain-containing protein [Aquisphaera giovannonii]QEH38713.1 HEAT repeat protein [Aquisphaera giovannonii]